MPNKYVPLAFRCIANRVARPEWLIMADVPQHPYVNLITTNRENKRKRTLLFERTKPRPDAADAQCRFTFEKKLPERQMLLLVVIFFSHYSI